MRQTAIRQVGIIGSGIAGLSLAIQLQALGVSATVLEKGRGPGGRLASKRVPGGSVDIGAQYFTIRNNGFRDFLDAYAGESSYGQWHGVLFREQAPGLPEPFHAADRFVGVPRMTGISRALSRHVDARYEVRADSLVASGDQWLIRDSEGNDHGPFDAVVVTAPPVQARELVRNQPQVRDALSEFHMWPTWSVAVRYDTPLNLEFDGMSLADSVLGWVARDASKPARDSGEWWVLHATSDWSWEHRNDTAETVMGVMSNAFAERFNHGQHPEDIIAHRWLYARPEAGSGPVFKAFPEGLAFCGDWLNGGRVEGAWESADGLLQHWLDNGDIDARTTA